MVSIGGSSSKSKSRSQSQSSTQFPKKFFEEAEGFFGGDPGYDPAFTGFDDFQRLEDTLYGTQQAKIQDAYSGAKKLRNEQLSLSGLLNSPSRYIEGGADDTLDKNFLSSIQQAARDAALGRLETERGEAARATEFSVDTATKILNSFLQKLGIATQAGRTSTSSGTGDSSSGGFSVGILGSSR